MGKNYIQRQNDVYMQGFEDGEITGIQKMADYLSGVLKDPRFVGSDTFGRARLNKIFEGLKWYADEYAKCFTDNVEADYAQECLDRVQREAWGEDSQPFFKRYPFIKKLGYKKPRKGWVD